MKKIVSLLLAAILTLGCMAGACFAADVVATITYSDGTSVEATSVAELMAAIRLEDTTGTSAKTVDGKTVVDVKRSIDELGQAFYGIAPMTINLNGYTLSSSNSSTVAVKTEGVKDLGFGTSNTITINGSAPGNVQKGKIVSKYTPLCLRTSSIDVVVTNVDMESTDQYGLLFDNSEQNGSCNGTASDHTTGSFTNCTFTSKKQMLRVLSTYTDVTFDNCIFTTTAKSTGIDIVEATNGSLTFNNCEISTYQGFTFSHTNAHDSTVTMTDCALTTNFSKEAGGYDTFVGNSLGCTYTLERCVLTGHSRYGIQMYSAANTDSRCTWFIKGSQIDFGSERSALQILADRVKVTIGASERDGVKIPTVIAGGSTSSNTTYPAINISNRPGLVINVDDLIVVNGSTQETFGNSGGKVSGTSKLVLGDNVDIYNTVDTWCNATYLGNIMKGETKVPTNKTATGVNVSYMGYTLNNANRHSIGNAYENYVETEVGAAVSTITFADISKDFWGYKAIMNAAKAGLVKGKSENADGTMNYVPNASMTRAEFITVICRYFYPAEAENAVGGFKWWTGYYDLALDKEILQLADLDGGDLDKAMTREEMALVLSRTAPAQAAYASVTPAQESAIPDAASISAEYKEAVLWAYGAGLLKGVDDKGTFNPKGELNRAAVATIFNTLLSSK